MKKKRKVWEKVLCTAAAVAVLAGGGFLGVEKFHPQKRSLQIIGGDAQQTSAKAGAEGLQKASTEGGMKIDAKAAVLIDGNSGRVLFAQNAKKHLPPASVTKVMTLLLLLDACDKGKIATNDKVTISENAASMGGSQMYLEPGEQHTVEELLKGVIMASANDGAVALAEHLSGSVEEFVDDMNAKAAEMGLKNSHFVNTNGLPVAEHYSCAYDIGMICRQLMTYEFARDWFTAWQEDIKVGLPGKEKDFTLTNTNKMIRTYKGAIGGKTGFTQDAGYCLAEAAQRDSTRMIAVVLGCKDSKVRFAETARLLDHGFASYETVPVAKKGQKLRTITLPKSDQQEVAAVPEETIAATVKKGKKANITKKISIDKSVACPVKKGEKVGMIHIYDGNKKIASYPLVSDRDAEKAGFMTLYIRMIKNLV